MSEQREITKDQALGLLFNFWKLFVETDEEIRIANDLEAEARLDGDSFAWQLWGNFTATCEMLRDAESAIEQMIETGISD